MSVTRRVEACTSRAKLLLIWENFGPMHFDRLEAADRALPEREVEGVQLGGRSHVYAWTNDYVSGSPMVTLFPDREIGRVDTLSKLRRLLRVCLRRDVSEIFFCHYEHPTTFLAASLSRLAGKKTFVMNDSKYDDYARTLLKELIKSVFYLPYHGAMSSGRRSRDYLNFLGFRSRPVASYYNAISSERMARLRQACEGSGEAFDHRPFLIVARFIEKKNIPLAIRAFALFCERSSSDRELILCGSGGQDAALRTLVQELGLEARVRFTGFLQAEDVAGLMGRALALILPSTEEQFGNVVLEAQCMRLPVLVSSACGVCDEVVRTGVNGFVFEPDNAEGLCFFMELISGDEPLWRRLADEAGKRSTDMDAANFAGAVRSLIGLDARREA